MNTSVPTNINQARRQANCYTKALSMKADGYVAENVYSHGRQWDIFKPGNECGLCDYTVMDGKCDCPDFTKHGDFCKHTQFVEMERAADEEAMWAAICEEYDLRAKFEW